jgi:hypothetical protein
VGRVKKLVISNILMGKKDDHPFNFPADDMKVVKSIAHIDSPVDSFRLPGDRIHKSCALSNKNAGPFLTLR